MKHYQLLKALVLCTICVGLSSGFLIPGPSSTLQAKSYVVPSQNTLSQNSYSSTQVWARREDENDNVNVNIIPDVDAATLTAVGFGLIAFNFFVLANLGDGGIGGLLATIINMSRE